MKLKKFLEEIDDGQMICIGSKSGYVYFGEKGDGSKIVDRFYEHLRKTKRYLAKANTDLVRIMTTEFNENLSEEELTKQVRERANRISHIVYSIEQYDKFIKEYRNPMYREVVDSYQKEVDDCLAIVISGNEPGDFWLKSEYDQRYCS